ncbi:hypothetical protein Raf01_74830 [Rugosimonospora africana]|uniref:IPT/TIG domain-containing protein n=1 Tax=Rugosimonospora africana TaxID=556532 RepID=A0A8J3R399_9ACTN|nr:hypothetical protein Raf01_74830 [Rugosimonospora africana]
MGIDSVTPDEGSMRGGFTVTVTGVGFAPGQTTVRICGIDIPPASVPVNPQGNILTFTAPACTAGQTQLLVTTPTGSASTVFVYDEETLPVTGSQIRAPLMAGTGLIVVGALTLVLARRRPRTAAAVTK